jgi:hypothetical protein
MSPEVPVKRIEGGVDLTAGDSTNLYGKPDHLVERRGWLRNSSTHFSRIN